MKYDTILKNIPNNQIEEVKMEDGTIIKCKKVPLETFNTMDVALSGVKDAIAFSGVGLNYIASCGSTPLFSAVGDINNYIQKKDGSYMSSTRGVSGKISGQPGFQAVGNVTQEGTKAAASMAKAIPYIAIALAVIEIGFKIWKRKKEIEAEQIEGYIRYRQTMQKHAKTLWQFCNETLLILGDDFYRGAAISKAMDAFIDAKDVFDKLAVDGKKFKKVNENLIYSMKAALDVYSFSYLLKIVFSKVEDCQEIINNAIADIEEKTKTYNAIYEKCHSQYLAQNAKNSKFLDTIQFNNKNPSREDVAKRVGFNLLSGGTAEIASAITKQATKKGTKTSIALQNIEKCKSENNPYVECIKNTYSYLEHKKAILRDDKYLYYQVD